jgi:hypothetical protein
MQQTSYFLKNHDNANFTGANNMKLDSSMKGSSEFPFKKPNSADFSPPAHSERSVFENS